MKNESKIKNVISKVTNAVEKDVYPNAKKVFDSSKEIAEQTGRIVSGIVSDTQDKVNVLVNKTKESMHDAKVEMDKIKFNPIFNSAELEDFEMVCISDQDKKRSESEACEGSIGHYENVKKGLRILNIYKKDLNKFNFKFYPNSKYGFYYISPVEKDKLIRLENYFEYIKDQRVAELHEIGYKIGASFVQVSYKEQQKTLVSKSFDFKEKTNKGKDADINSEQSSSKSEKNYLDLMILDSAHYHDNKPTQPKLDYFADDKRIRSLIEAALQGEADDGHINIQYNTSVFMNRETAIKIDATLKQYGANGNGSITSEVEKESRTELDFYVEFPKK